MQIKTAGPGLLHQSNVGDWLAIHLKNSLLEGVVTTQLAEHKIFITMTSLSSCLAWDLTTASQGKQIHFELQAKRVSAALYVTPCYSERLHAMSWLVWALRWAGGFPLPLTWACCAAWPREQVSSAALADFARSPHELVPLLTHNPALSLAFQVRCETNDLPACYLRSSFTFLLSLRGSSVSGRHAFWDNITAGQLQIRNCFSWMKVGLLIFSFCPHNQSDAQAQSPALLPGKPTTSDTMSLLHMMHEDGFEALLYIILKLEVISHYLSLSLPPLSS